MWPIMPSSFPPKPWVKTRGFNVWKMSCDGSTHFASFNSWQKLDGETSIVRFGHHSSTYLEGLMKFWGFWGSSAPPYFPFCTLKVHTFDPIPLDNPTEGTNCKLPNTYVHPCWLQYIILFIRSTTCITWVKLWSMNPIQRSETAQEALRRFRNDSVSHDSPHPKFHSWIEFQIASWIDVKCILWTLLEGRERQRKNSWSDLRTREILTVPRMSTCLFIGVEYTIHGLPYCI